MSFGKKKKIKKWLVIIILTAISIFNLYPYLFVVTGSLKPSYEIFSGLLPKKLSSLSFSNYTEVFSMKQVPFLKAFFNSLFVTGFVTLSVIIFSAITGYTIAKLKFKGRNLLLNFVVFQWIFPGTGVGFIVVFSMINKFNLMNTYTSMIIPFMMTAWGVYLFSQFFKTIPKDIIEAARIDGASELQVIFKIMLPMSKSVAVILGIFTFMGRWNELLWDLLVVRKPGMMTLNLLISNYFLGGGGKDNIGVTFTAAVLLTMPILILFIIFRGAFTEGISIGEGLKL